MPEWRKAYTQRGRGSTFVRASIIAEDVYEKAAPIPELIPSPDRNQFLHEVIRIVDEAAQETGAELL